MTTDEIGQGHELPKTQPTHPAMVREWAERYLTSGLPLRPHLTRTGLISGRLALESARAIVEPLAVLNLAAAVLSHAHRIVAANELMIKLIPGHLQDRSHRVALTDRRADALLEKALLHVSRQSSSSDVCSIPIAETADNPPSIMHVVPLSGAARDTFPAASCILIFRLVNRLIAPASDIVQALFGLTPAEVRVAVGIVRGQTPTEIASDARVSVNTVKTQLKAVFEKAGVSRQAELVALLASVAFPR
jgi:DNA-binding CsgD family transcriptional regulator